MKQVIFKYGKCASLSICLLFIISWYALQFLSYTAQEIVGYASMVLALLFVYFGIKYFRDKVNQGKLSFKQAFLIGLGISGITAIAFGLLDVLYVTVLNPDFMQDYYQNTLTQWQSTLPAEAYAAKVAQLENQKAMFENPLILFLLMAMTVFTIGFIITLISSLILQRKP